MQWLFIHQNFPGQFRDLVPQILQRGDQVCAIGSRQLSGGYEGMAYARYTLQQEREPGRLTDPDLEQNLLRAGRAAPAARQLKQQGLKPDVIVFHSGWGEGLYLRELWPGVPLIAYPELYASPELMGHGFDPDLPPASEGVRQALKRQNFMALAAIADSDAAITPTLFQRNTFPEHLRGRFQVIHEGVDLERLGPNPRRHIRLNPDLMLGPDDPVLTLVNRSLEPLRGYRQLMRALPALQQRHPRLHTLIVGSDQGSSYSRPSSHPRGYRGELEALLGDQLDASRIHHLGTMPHQELIALYQLSKVHIYLSYPYALGWSLLEAMACGAAVVGSGNAPVSEVIQHGHNGLLVPFHNTAALADAISDLLEDRSQAARLGAAARSHIEQHYNLTSSVEHYRTLAHSLALS